MSQFPKPRRAVAEETGADAPLMSAAPSVQVADGQINGENVRLSPWSRTLNNHYPRTAGGEVGLLEGWTLAKVVNETIAADADQPVKRPIVAVIDVPSGGRWPPRRSFWHRPGAGRGGWRLCQSPSGRPPGNWLIVGKAMSGVLATATRQPADRL